MRRTLAFAVAVVLLVTVVVVLVVASGRDSSPEKAWTAPSPTGETVDPALAPFYGQKLAWEACGRSQCTWVEVPVDYAEASGPTTRLRVRVVPASGDGGRVLFVNPGGPGGSAYDFASQIRSLLPDDVVAAYDVVGVDPRGVGRSTPVQCLDDADFDAYLQIDPTPDDESEIAAYRAGTVTLGDACRDNDGPLAAHLSTEEGVRDLDVVRALLGQTTFDWFGASYGTTIGATYATLFPQKVGRMVLDGAVDPSLNGIESSFGQAVGFQRALTAFLESCVDAGDCVLGDSVEAAEQRLVDFMADLDQKPLKVGDRTLGEGLAFFGLALPLYDKAGWPALNLALTQALDGDGGTLMTLADLYFERSSDGAFATNGGEVISAVNCLDQGRDATVEEVEGQLDRFEAESPVFGRAMAWAVLTCTDWPIPATHPQVAIDASAAGPIVVIGTTRDPATPFEWSEALTRQLGPNASLLVREGDGHTALSSGNDCILDLVEAYLLDGEVPKSGTRCEDD